MHWMLPCTTFSQNTVSGHFQLLQGVELVFFHYSLCTLLLSSQQSPPLTGELSQEYFNSGCRQGGHGDAWVHSIAASWAAIHGADEEEEEEEK